MSRVAVTVEQFWHKVPGGTAYATAQTLIALAQDSTHEFIGVAARHNKDETDLVYGSGPARPTLSADMDIFFARWPRPLLYEAWHRARVPSVQSIVGSPVDVIWASAMVVPPATAPLVVTVNDLDFLEHPEWLSNRGKRFFPRAWRAARDRADLVVCPSETTARACEANGVERSRIRVVPLGVDAVRVSTSTVSSVREFFDLPEEFVLWVGTLEPRKNLERVVAAVKSIKGRHLVIVGPAGWNMDDKTLVATLGPRAHVLGAVSTDHLRALYGAASVFVFPSLAEGFGLPVLEAMAQGTPVVTSKGTATADAAQGAAVLVEPTSVDEIRDAINSILTEPGTASELSEAGLAVAQKSTWAATAAGYSAAFSEVCL